MPKVSVIVTTYNRKEFLAETIQSILDQTYQDFELIVVDNYSNYDFFALIKSFNSEKITPFQNQNNGIIAVNRNIGISHAKGEYIAFCDDDDIWLPEKLQLQMAELDQNNADLVYSNTILCYESGVCQITNYRPTSSINRLLHTNHITLSSVLVRNNRLIHFNENSLLAGIEDYDLWLKLILNEYIFRLIRTPLVKFRVLNSSFSSLSRSKNEFKIIQLKKSLLYNNSKLTLFNKTILVYSLFINRSKFLILKTLNR